VLHSAHRYYNCWDRGTLLLHTNNDPDLQELIGSKPANPANDSFDISLVKGWIDTCCKTHRLCNRKRECWYPTRLLHIISSDQARLILSEDHAPKGYYITLSHRWGNFQYTKLLTETLAQLQSVIAVSHLPPAFRDAIKVATLLDIEYIWIDGLCIKQDPDDRSDWKVESLKMGKVYENAFLNISATLAVDGNEPLLPNQQLSSFGLSEMTFSIDDTQDVFYLLDGDIWIDEITSAPLNKRGWVFQERFLAKRVLHFSTRQLGWECEEMTALEMLPKGLPAILGRPLAKKLIQSVLSKRAPDAPHSSIEEWLGTWHDIVNEYSKGSFTFPADKLIAFAGIGPMISEHIGTEYISGMLLGSLTYDLAWWRWMEDRTRFPLIDACTRAPSWSWASVDGEINFPVDGANLRNSRTFIKNIGIIRERNDLLNNHSRLRVQGVCMPLRVTWSEGDIFEFSISELAACRFTTEGESGASSIDCDIPLEEMRDLERRGCILVLPLYSTTLFFYSLLIHRKRGRGSHRRIGLVTIPVRVQTATEDMIDTGLTKAHLMQWRRDKKPKAEDEPFNHWNRKALGLMDHVESSMCRTIEIS